MQYLDTFPPFFVTYISISEHDSNILSNMQVNNLKTKFFFDMSVRLLTLYIPFLFSASLKSLSALLMPIHFLMSWSTE